MSEQRAILADTVERLFRDAAAGARGAADEWHASLWPAVEEMGLPLLLVPEEAGGIGGAWEDALIVLHALGRHAIALPLAEAMLAARLTALAGLGVPSGVVTLAAKTAGRVDRSPRANVARFTGELAGVPWGHQAASVVGVVRQESEVFIVLLPRAAACSLAARNNVAGEARDTLHFEDAEVAASHSSAAEAMRLHEFGALLRVGQIAGALHSVLARTVQYAQERTQFGKAIGGFQAVQQQLAQLAAEAAAVGCAARAAFRAVDRAADQSGFEIAAAKLRANIAIGTATAIAHQVHGAIGFTREYELRRGTQRLWSWRSEFGNDRYWSGVLGAAVAARGADEFWPDLTRRGDHAAQPITS